MLATGLVVAAALNQRTVLSLLAPQARAQAIAGAVLLLAATWLALLVAKRDEWSAAALSFAGYTAVYAALVVAWSTGGTAREMAALRGAITSARRSGDVEIVSYRTFMKGLPWLMKAPVPFVDPGGELAEGAATIGDPESPLAWTEARFWERWHRGGRLLAMVSERAISEFERNAGGAPFIVARARRQLLVSNFDPVVTPSGDPAVSTALYVSTERSTPVPIDSVPAGLLAVARRELKGAAIVRGIVEQTGPGFVYELASGGQRPRVVEVDRAGRVVYLEELVELREVPGAVLAALERAAPRLSVAFVKRALLRGGHLDRYEVFVSDGPSLREVEIDSSGRCLN